MLIGLFCLEVATHLGEFKARLKWDVISQALDTSLLLWLQYVWWSNTHNRSWDTWSNVSWNSLVVAKYWGYCYLGPGTWECYQNHSYSFPCIFFIWLWSLGCSLISQMFLFVQHWAVTLEVGNCWTWRHIKLVSKT